MTLMEEVLGRKERVFNSSRSRLVSPVARASSKVVPPTSFQRIPPTSFQRIPEASVKRVPPTSFQRIPPTSCQRIPPTSFQRIPPTSFQRIPPTSFQRIPEVSVTYPPALGAVKDTRTRAMRVISHPRGRHCRVDGCAGLTNTPRAPVERVASIYHLRRDDRKPPEGLSTPSFVTRPPRFHPIAPRDASHLPAFRDVKDSGSPEASARSALSGGQAGDSTGRRPTRSRRPVAAGR